MRLPIMSQERMCREVGEFYRLLLELRSRSEIYFTMSAAQSGKMLKETQQNELAQLPQSSASLTATGIMGDT